MSSNNGNNENNEITIVNFIETIDKLNVAETFTIDNLHKTFIKLQSFHDKVTFELIRCRLNYVGRLLKWYKDDAQKKFRTKNTQTDFLAYSLGLQSTQTKRYLSGHRRELSGFIFTKEVFESIGFEKWLLSFVVDKSKDKIEIDGIKHSVYMKKPAKETPKETPKNEVNDNEGNDSGNEEKKYEEMTLQEKIEHNNSILSDTQIKRNEIDAKIEALTDEREGLTITINTLLETIAELNKDLKAEIAEIKRKENEAKAAKVRQKRTYKKTG